MQRRVYLSTLSTSIAVGLAGCGGASNSDGNSGNDEEINTSTPDPQPTTSTKTTDTPDNAGESDQPQLEIINVSAPENIDQGDELQVEISLQTPESVTVRVLLIKEDEDVVEKSQSVESGTNITTDFLFETADLQAGGYSLTVEIDSESVDYVQPVEIVETLAPWEEDLQAAEEYIHDALEAYAESADADDASIINITATSTEFEYISVGEILFNADERLSDARDYDVIRPGTEEREKVRQVQNESDLLRSIADWQGDMISIYDDFSKINTRILADIDEAIEEATDSLEDIKQELEEITPKIGEHYSDKIEQGEFELTQFEQMEDGSQEYRSAENALDRGDNEDAKEKARFARRTFQDVRFAVGEPTNAPPTDRADDDFADLAREWEDEAEELERDA